MQSGVIKTRLGKTKRNMEKYVFDYGKYDEYVLQLFFTIKQFLISKNKLVKKGDGLFGFSRIKPTEQRISNKYFVDTDKLNNGILELRYNKNRHLTNVKSQVIGNGLKTM
jgi:hypothetical protein